MKLSAKQLEVVRLMAEGWQLWAGIYGVRLLQKGEAKEIHSSTLFALEKAKVIEWYIESLPLNGWRLTDLGRQVAQEEGVER